MMPQNSQQIVKIAFLVFTMFIISLLWYSLDIDVSSVLQRMRNNKVQNTTLQVQNTTPKVQDSTMTTVTPKQTILLVWDWPWGQQFDINNCDTKFGISACKLTKDRSLYNIADAVIMHYADIMYNKNSLPSQPRPNFQHWVWLNLEPPHIINNLDKFDNIFNMTMSFRRDSDIFSPYGQLEAFREPQNFTMPYTKSKLVAWVVSKWYPGAKRIGYYEEFKKHIQIDVYGAGRTPLSDKDFHPTLSQYKFYLSFENSVYKDYITEKLFRNAFNSWAVPVVLGTSRKNYEIFVPGDSFIHVDDFASPKELADYLHELDKNNEKYLKYFNWRSRYEVKMYNWPYLYCSACTVLKQSRKYHTAHDLSQWFLKDV